MPSIPGEPRLQGLKRSMAGDFCDEEDDESVGEQTTYEERTIGEMDFREGKGNARTGKRNFGEMDFREGKVETAEFGESRGVAACMPEERGSEEVSGNYGV